MKTILTFLLLWAPASFAGEARHFVYLFAADDGMQTPTGNHTWASFVEVRGERVHAHTINWLPRSKVIRPLAAGPERGANLPASYPIEWAERDGLTLAQWGPYEIRPELYDLAVKQETALAGGDIWYRVVDFSNRVFKRLDPTTVPQPRALMCVHAVSDVVYGTDERGFLLTGYTSGIPATAMVAWHLKPWYVTQEVADETRALMDDALGLEGHRWVKQSLTEVTNRYCRTSQECREAGM